MHHLRGCPATIIEITTTTYTAAMDHKDATILRHLYHCMQVQGLAHKKVVSTRQLRDASGFATHQPDILIVMHTPFFGTCGELEFNYNQPANCDSVCSTCTLPSLV
jgi:hypothetical protein